MIRAIRVVYFTTNFTNPTNVGGVLVTNYHELTVNLGGDNSCDSCDSCCVYFTTNFTNPTNVGGVLVTNYHELTVNLGGDNSCDSCDSCCLFHHEFHESHSKFAEECDAVA